MSGRDVRYIPFDPEHVDQLPISDAERAELRKWLTKAADAARAAIDHYEATGQRPNENNDLWGQHKQWLLRNVFLWKCAYCEKSLADIPRDAEHWRPKRGITYKSGEQPVDPSHVGYFWLAYSWQNLLPACSMCNSYDGKLNQFPVERAHVFLVKLTADELAALRDPPRESGRRPGEYYLSPRDLDDIEGPLLLHPYFDEHPEDHLSFGDLGEIEGRTPKGSRTIDVLSLDREALIVERAAAQRDMESAFDIVRGYWRTFKQKSNDEAVAKAWADFADDGWLDGSRPFFAASVAVLRRAHPPPPGYWRPVG